uniref:Ciliogenesis and planar polarity effector 2 n=1 Tax=Pelusios castaneus TaxID=367368 RepID=A0A8C8RNJ0_9SAUR
MSPLCWLLNMRVPSCPEKGLWQPSASCELTLKAADNLISGIQTTTVYWPAKLRDSGRALIFRFHFWDCGEAALKKFDHILPACKEKADCILFLFSFTDRSSFDDLPNQISRVTEGSENLVKIVIGSKFDQFMHADVTERDLAEFRRAWHLPILRMKSVNGPRLADRWTLDGRAGLAEVAHVLNGLAEHLWYHDQVMAGLVPAPQPGTEETSPC